MFRLLFDTIFMEQQYILKEIYMFRIQICRMVNGEIYRYIQALLDFFIYSALYINKECRTKCHPIDCTHNTFLLLQKHLTSGRELILIGWKIVPNESL